VVQLEKKEELRKEEERKKKMMASMTVKQVTIQTIKNSYSTMKVNYSNSANSFPKYFFSNL
jgi:hypothetical protein